MRFLQFLESLHLIFKYQWVQFFVHGSKSLISRFLVFLRINEDSKVIKFWYSSGINGISIACSFMYIIVVSAGKICPWANHGNKSILKLICFASTNEILLSRTQKKMEKSRELEEIVSIFFFLVLQLHCGAYIVYIGYIMYLILFFEKYVCDKGWSFLS